MTARVETALSVTSSGPDAAWPRRAGTYVSAHVAAWRCRSGAARECSAVRRRGPRPPRRRAGARRSSRPGARPARETRPCDPVEACRRAAAGGATIIQVRLKDAPPEEVVALARALVGALAVPVIVNDRVDVALAAGAAGAHLGQEDPPLDRLRPHVPPDFL